MENPSGRRAIIDVILAELERKGNRRHLAKSLKFPPHRIKR